MAVPWVAVRSSPTAANLQLLLPRRLKASSQAGDRGSGGGRSVKTDQALGVVAVRAQMNLGKLPAEAWKKSKA